MAGAVAFGASSLPAADTFVSTDSFAYVRREDTATLLPTGKVLLAGDSGPNLTARSELYGSATLLRPHDCGRTRGESGNQWDHLVASLTSFLISGLGAGVVRTAMGGAGRRR